jgi:uncharacterized protein YbjQ (UPF0145 family)
MANKQLVSGSSSNGSLDEAVKDAVEKMLELASQHGADLIVNGQLASIDISAGGFAGKREVIANFVFEVIS